MNIVEFERFFNVNVKNIMFFAKTMIRVMKNQRSREIQKRKYRRDLNRNCIINIDFLNFYVAIFEIVQYMIAKHAFLKIIKNANQWTSK